MQTLENYALAYARKGFYVLPIAPMEKQPLMEFADQPAMDAAKIKRAWKRHPNADIAFRTVDFFVIDIDEHKDGADGKSEFKRLVSQHPDWFPDTLKQTTAHGGWQLFYKKPAGVEMTQAIGWLPGVDVKAHVNNYVLVAPSHGYKWANKLAIAEAPAALVKAVRSKIDKHGKTSAGTMYSQPTLTESERQQGSHSKTAELFEQITNGLGETGGRNMALAAFVGGLLFRNVNPQVVYELAQQANENTAKSLDAREFDRTFESMLKKERRRRVDGQS